MQPAELLLQAGLWRAGAPVGLLGCYLGRMTQVLGLQLRAAQRLQASGLLPHSSIGCEQGKGLAWLHTAHMPSAWHVPGAWDPSSIEC